MKRKILVFLLCLTFAFAAFNLSSCRIKEYIITFNILDDEITYSPCIKAEETYQLPEKTKEGYVFDGWYKNSDLTGEKLTSYMGTSDITLYGKWFACIDELSAAGNNFYFKTKKYADDMVAINFSDLLGGEEFIRTYGDYYWFYLDEDVFSATYSFVECYPQMYFTRQGVSIMVDKSYANLTPDKIREKYASAVSQGTVTQETLDTLIERKYLENILYRYKIEYSNSDEHCYFYYDSLVFKDTELMTEAVEFFKSKYIVFMPFYDSFFYNNEYIQYVPSYDSSKINSPMVEPDSVLIKNIETGLKNLFSETTNFLNK